MNKRDKLEPLADGWVGFHTESGDHWKHKDVTETGPTGTRCTTGCSFPIKGEQSRYTFAPKDPRDSTVWDLREQLRRSDVATAGAGTR